MMTAHQLANRLLSGPDLPVHFSYTAGDYWRTQVAPAVKDVGDMQVVHSDYHSMPRLTDEDETGQRVVVLG